VTLWQAIVIAVVEGITEFLPVSSTGHMILASTAMGIAQEDFTKLFTVVIQLGAILSVLVLYWRRFLQSLDFYFKLFVAFIPAVIFGLLFGDWIDALLENAVVVGIMLLVGGIIFLFVDRWFERAEQSADHSPSYTEAFKIGLFQCLAMIPGVSRSAATIIGGLSQGLNRKSAAEFSFFLAVPTMLGATAKKSLDYYQDGISLSAQEVNLLIVGNAVAFLVAMLAIKTFITFLTRHGFKVFGYYRLIAGAVILLLFALGKLEMNLPF
jgi:undecaprenyl-diphosphatase